MPLEGIGKAAREIGMNVSDVGKLSPGRGVECAERNKGLFEFTEANYAGDLEKSKRDLSEGVGDYNSDAKEKVREKTGWSDKIIDSIGSKEEADIYMDAGLEETDMNGNKVLIRNDIDIDQKDEDGITNRDRMERGRPPVTKDGEEVELHHIGQKQDSPLAELTTEEHRGVGNDTILHDKTKESEINRSEFAKERQEHWKNRIEHMEQGE